jgi:hypothetical protein
MEGRAKALSMLLKILLNLGKRSEIGHAYPPLEISNEFDSNQVSVVLEHRKFFITLLNSMGLRMEVEEHSTTNPISTPLPAQKCFIFFNIQYPLRVYTLLAEHLTEFYADADFVTTGKWERPIYV